jgi:protein-S-isoprenylcysteine O-methyltransferase Ste14
VISSTQGPASGRILLGAGLFAIGFLLLAVAGLHQWGSTSPWSRLDLFSGSYLLLAAVLVIQQGSFARQIAFSKEKMEEAFGLNYDPGWMKRAYWLGLAELLIFIDYGHLRLTPFLERRPLQAAGIVLMVAAIAWLGWVDRYLGLHFQDDLTQLAVMNNGPYRYIRHPRYAGLIASRIACALILASAVAWLLAFCWVMLTLRRIRLEEPHLAGLFGQSYKSYAARTPRLIPWLY